MMQRCGWLTDDPIYIEYHDNEWGVPLHDDQKLFEFLCLEGAQAGLSWLTILKKRENYRKFFFNFDIKKVAQLPDDYLHDLLQEKGIVRNRLKVFAFRKNAQAALKLIERFGSLDTYLWGFVDNKPILNQFKTLDEVPAKTALSEKISKDMKKRGFTFVGPTIIYAFMQAVGMVDDHTIDCFLAKK